MTYAVFQCPIFASVQRHRPFFASNPSSPSSRFLIVLALQAPYLGMSPPLLLLLCMLCLSAVFLRSCYCRRRAPSQRRALPTSQTSPHVYLCPKRLCGPRPLPFECTRSGARTQRCPALSGSAMLRAAFAALLFVHACLPTCLSARLSALNLIAVYMLPAPASVCFLRLSFPYWFWSCFL